MKFLLGLMLFSSVAFAAEGHMFYYRMTVNGRVQKHACYAKENKEDALMDCAQKCSQHFSSMGYPLTEERKRDIADACAHPTKD